MEKNEEILKEIKLLVEYAVLDANKDKALLLLEKYRDDSLALSLIKEFFVV